MWGSVRFLSGLQPYVEVRRCIQCVVFFYTGIYRLVCFSSPVCKNTEHFFLIFLEKAYKTCGIWRLPVIAPGTAPDTETRASSSFCAVIVQNIETVHGVSHVTVKGQHPHTRTRTHTLLSSPPTHPPTHLPLTTVNATTSATATTTPTPLTHAHP